MSSLKDKYFTISQVSKELGVSRQTISRWVAKGRFRIESVGREKLISKAQIDTARFSKLVIAGIADMIKKQYYLSDDEVRSVSNNIGNDFDFIVRKSDGILEKVKVTKFSFDINEKFEFVVGVKEIERKPYSKK